MQNLNEYSAQRECLVSVQNSPVNGRVRLRSMIADNAEADALDPVSWCFVTIGSYVTLIAIIFILLGLCNIENKIFRDQNNDLGKTLI